MIAGGTAILWYSTGADVASAVVAAVLLLLGQRGDRRQRVQ
jgi:citrate synthase